MERKKLTAEEVETELANASGWTVENDRLKRRFSFPDFAEALAFVNKVGDAAEALDHHPDIKLGWGYAEIEITTHDRGGITDMDFELAGKIDRLE
jgi:4a-hydroxytetrahydrobiopterin dehydratase